MARWSGYRSGVSYSKALEQWVNYNENGDGPSSRTQRNVGFSEQMLYSYRTPMARYHNWGKSKFVLVLRDTFTPSTSRQVRNACGYVNVPVFHTDYIGARGGMNNEPVMGITELHAVNQAKMWERVLGYLDRIGKKFKEDDYWHYTEAVRKFNASYDELDRYRTITGNNIVPLTLRQDLLDEADKVAAENKHKFYHPNAVAKRERAHARRVARVAFGLSTEKKEDA